jgi:hypothetical protein
MPHTSTASSGNISCDRSFLCQIFLWLIASLFPVILFTSHFLPAHSRESGNPGDSAMTRKIWPFRETTKRRLKSRLTVKGYFVNLFMCKVAAKPIALCYEDRHSSTMLIQGTAGEQFTPKAGLMCSGGCLKILPCSHDAGQVTN